MEIETQEADEIGLSAIKAGVEASRGIALKEKANDSSVAVVATMSEETRWTTLRIWKNLAIISINCFLVLASFNGVSYLQSSINRKDGMGMASQAIIYGSSLFMALLVPKIVIRRLGCKTALVIGILCFCPYIAYNFYPHWGTLIPGSVTTGLGSTIFWSSQATYVNRLSNMYCKQSKESRISVNALFFGILGTAYSSAGICGSLISFYVLAPIQHAANIFNNTLSCGANYLETVVANISISNVAEPNTNQRYTLVAIYMMLAVIAVILVIVFPDSVETSDNSIPTYSAKNDLKATVKVMKKTNQLLLLPLVVYTGLNYGFYVGDVTKAYVACGYGVHYVGLAGTCSAVCSCISVPLCGRLVKYIGQPLVIFVMAIINVAVFTIWLTWNPEDSTFYMLFVMSGLYAIYSSVMWSQMKSLYGFLFREDEEAGFANNCLWNDVGIMIVFGVGSHICVEVKLYVLIAMFCIGYIGYAAVECRTKYAKGCSA